MSSLRRRIVRLESAARSFNPPECRVYLPDNGRDDNSSTDQDGPVVIYDLANPPAELRSEHERATE